jgi:hypothetical protein
VIIIVSRMSRAQSRQQPQTLPSEATDTTAKRRRSSRLNGIDRLSRLSIDVLLHVCGFLVGRPIRAVYADFTSSSVLRRSGLSVAP